MLIDADLNGTDEAPPEVVHDEVEAGQVQPWMLLLNDQTGELYVALDPPAARLVDVDGRSERWVDIRVFGADEPMTTPAATRLAIVYGADPDELMDMLPEDMLSEEEEALAHNGMCHDRIVDDGEPVDSMEADADDQDEEPLYCGRPADPDSFYRACEEHDQARRERSARLAQRGYQPTYGLLAQIT